MASLNAEIVAIGSEVLAGITANTNAAEISKGLLQIGVHFRRHTVVPDILEVIKEELRQAVGRSDLVITTGGLGPTVDDLTRTAAADVFQSDFRFDPAIAEELKQRYGDKLLTIEDQATVPTKAKVLRNPVGTAPGFIFHDGGKILILLPGVPPEMRKMLAEQVIPYLKTAIPQGLRTHMKELHLFELPESAVDPTLRKLQAEYPAVIMGIYPNLGLLHITMTASAPNDEVAEKLLSPPMKQLQESFKEHVYFAPSGTIDEAVHLQLLGKGATLSLAESCTGGAIAARLVKHPGASEYLLGSIVAYSNGLKESILDVPKEVMKEHGAVSSETAEAMLKGVMRLTGSDYTVAVTGIAGPAGGTDDKPVGTIWCGAAKKDGALYTWKIKAYGSREMVIERSIHAVLSKLYKMLTLEE